MPTPCDTGQFDRWKVKYERAKALDETGEQSMVAENSRTNSGFAKASALSGYHTLGKLGVLYRRKAHWKKTTHGSAGYVFSKLPITRDIFKQTKFESPNTKALARYTPPLPERMKEASSSCDWRIGHKGDLRQAEGSNPESGMTFLENLHVV